MLDDLLVPVRVVLGVALQAGNIDKHDAKARHKALNPYPSGQAFR